MVTGGGGGANEQYFSYVLNCLSRAIELSPDWSYPHARILAMMTTSITMGYRRAYAPHLDKRETWEKILDQLEPPQAASRVLLALSRLAKKGSASAVGSEVRELLRHQPFDPELRFFSAWHYMYLGESESGLELISSAEKGLKLERYSAPALGAKSIAMLMLGQYEQALSEANMAAKLDPNYLSAYRFNAAALAHLGRLDEARDSLAYLPEGESISSIRSRAGYVSNEATERMFEGLRMAGLQE